MKKVEYYFDFLSPYSYLSWRWVRELDQRGDLDVAYFPCIMGAVIHHYETKGPAEITPKREYLLRNCLRFASRNGIPFNLPGRLPFISLDSLRLACLAVSQKDQKRVIDLLYQTSWGEGKLIEEESVLKEALSAAGLPTEELWIASQSKVARAALKENTARAISMGAFGVPSLFVDGELFWGNDSKEDFFSYLDGKDNLDRSIYKTFLDEFNRTLAT